MVWKEGAKFKLTDFAFGSKQLLPHLEIEKQEITENKADEGGVETERDINVHATPRPPKKFLLNRKLWLVRTFYALSFISEGWDK